MAAWLRPLMLWLVCGGSLGCAAISLRPAEDFRVLDAIEASLSSGRELSPRSLQTLRQLDLEEAYHEDARATFVRLQAEAEAHPEPPLLFALAELATMLGQRAEQNGGADSCRFYFLAAAYAYHYLFDADWTSRTENDRTPFDPRFRLACDLYNVALSHCIRTAQQAGRLDPRQQLHVPTSDGRTFTLTVEHHGFRWKPADFGPLLPCADYPLDGLANRHRTYGLGVPLIGTRPESRPAGKSAFYPDAVSFPVSAFFRFEGDLADLHRQRSGVLELYNPLAITRVTVRGQSVPLETDLTTPLAYFLAHTDLKKAELQGFLQPDTVENRAGIYMLEPYQPDKIPVIMVHGLLSSPLTWAPLFNDLQADPELRQRYQFWFYLYPTGPGYLQAAADLRRAFAQLRAEVDPRGQDPTLDQVVLVGHSMGGLVSRLMTVESGKKFWRLVSREPLEELSLASEARQALEDLFYFERQPWVRRVIFIGTPHHGSQLGNSVVGQLATRLVTAPADLLAAAEELAQMPQWLALAQGRPPTSVDLLSPRSPALHLLAEQRRPARVHFHSIIGQASPRTLLRELTRPILGNERTDGVVPVSSAHLEDVDSELVVPADHVHVHHHPLTVREVRRILRAGMPE